MVIRTDPITKAQNKSCPIVNLDLTRAEAGIAERRRRPNPVGRTKYSGVTNMSFMKLVEGIRIRTEVAR